MIAVAVVFALFLALLAVADLVPVAAERHGARTPR
jgi:hypothetical protein